MYEIVDILKTRLEPIRREQKKLPPKRVKNKTIKFLKKRRYTSKIHNLLRLECERRRYVM